MRNKKEKNLHFELNSNKKEICDFRADIYKIIPNSVSSDIFAMALQEILANAAEHGNKLDQNKKVLVDLEITGEYLYAEVEDQGQGFDWKNKIEKTLKLKSNSDRGRGIMMAVKACDKFYYNKKGNKAFLLKKIDF